ncbi:hypothetical protein VNI00_002113 [Paramarasmius palmivorus]|uniref:H/ACA ribonucleoprotein complex non-core subunit NAF1 n=1 Tax=Paramarasmius palmivorus TaxID=297713 RepID=A0AAW0E3J8_9AGAR
MDGFKIPSDIPQDLLLIQSLVGTVEYEKQQQEINTARPSPIDSSSSSGDSIDSSSSELDSEDEIEGELLLETEKDVEVSDSDSSSSSSSDDSDDESQEKGTQQKGAREGKDDDEMDADEEDSGPSANIQAYFRTKNEIAEVEVNVPDSEEVGSDEKLEKVGEVMSIVDNVVIVKGLASALANRGLEKALDSDTLLVFEDRKVFGYIYETFGPTTQPMYQVRFNSAYPLDSEKVRVSREVFHVPDRSNFVFTRQIAAMKGSDASNMNDEEPADHELDFSDDEAEAEFKRNLKKRRAGSRASSVAAASRQSTPTPSQMRDQDLNDDYTMGKSAFAEHGPYDSDYGGFTPSRPAPRPYDDPYSDEFNGVPSAAASSSSNLPMASTSDAQSNSISRPVRRDRERGSRGRGRGGRRNSGAHNHAGSQTAFGPHHDAQANPYAMQSYHDPQYPQWSAYQNNPGMQFDGGMPFQQPFVQPHINPRFASQLGMQFGFGQMQTGVPGGHPGQFVGGIPPVPPASFGHSPTQAQSPWTNDWVVPSSDETDPTGQKSQQH